MTADPPPIAPHGAGGPEDAAALAARLGIDLPPECVPGVRENAALLDRHWAALRAFVPPA